MSLLLHRLSPFMFNVPKSQTMTPADSAHAVVKAPMTSLTLSLFSHWLKANKNIEYKLLTTTQPICIS